MAGAEPFPLLNTGAIESHQPGTGSTPRRRRKSSALGGDIRAGDTGAPALATSYPHSKDVKESDTSSLSSSSGSNCTIHKPHRTHKKRSKTPRTVLGKVRDLAIRRTWAIPLAILLTLLLAYAVHPTASNPLHRFIFLSYRIPPTSPSVPAQYGKGLWDIALVTFYTVVLTFTREFVMQEVLRPLARRAGLRSRQKQSRFMEQLYTALYFSVLGPAGMYVMSRTPVWYFSTYGMYADFPHKTHEAVFKFYYLFQAAYWAQQAIVMLLGMEEPRKDFRELVGHHIVSLALIALSYRFHFTYMGLAVYITHDISDFFLATSKVLNYINHDLTGPYFALFTGVWIYGRHYLNLKILWSILTEMETVGPFEVNWETGQYKCRLAQVITFSLLAALQGLNLFWLFFILRIAYRFVFSGEASDDRSEVGDSEGERQEELEKLVKEQEEEEREEYDDESVEVAKQLNGHANGTANGNGYANGHLKENVVPNGAVKKRKSKAR